MRCTPDASRQLDFDAIRSIIADFCLTAEGANMIMTRPFLHDQERIMHEIALVQEYRHCLDTITIPHRDNFPPIASIVDALSTPEAALSPIDCYKLAQYLLAVHTLSQTFITYGQDSIGKLRNCFADIPNLKHFAKRILKVIDEEGQLIIAHIDKLDTIQQQRTDAVRYVESELKSVHRRNTAYYQSPIPVVRNNRLCLALNADFLPKVRAVVIEQSASGNTLFIEPLSCVELNNRWMRYTQKFYDECRKFILELGEEIRAACSQIKIVLEKFLFLDSVLARAQFAKKFDCYTAQTAHDRIALYRARHPLLGNSAVPIDVIQESGCHATVISGANGGGKTVTLKSIGVMILMYYFAMQIPAAEGSLIPRCDNLLLLIGDKQSIQSKHSSFTAQIAQVSGILNTMNSRSVVLFDELGGNTDPEEGAALATAIVQHCVDKQVTTFITTHFSQLKERAINSEHMQLISMSYNHRQHKPIFTTVAGVVEGSHALDTAGEIGLDSTIIQNAMQLLNSDAVKYKKMLAILVQQQRDCDIQKKDLAQSTQDLQKRERQLEEREHKMRAAHISEIEQLISSSRRQLEGLIAQLREKNISLPTKEIHTQMRATNDKLLHEVKEMRTEIASHSKDASVAQFHVGDAVYLDSNSTLLKVNDIIDAETIEIIGGALRLQVHPSRVRHADRADSTAGTVADIAADTHTRYSGTQAHAFSAVIDVRGKRVHEVGDVVLQHLDEALRTGHKEFAIIHGIGSGALQDEISKVLHQKRHIARWRYADAHNGGRGKTMVTLGGADA